MKPIIGQEAVVPGYGLGRIMAIDNKGIRVKPYGCSCSIVFDKKDVKLVKIHYEETE
jgi:RNA polymerase-interacting CarD/CdnL/TRCF family regulator